MRDLPQLPRQSLEDLLLVFESLAKIHAVRVRNLVAKLRDVFLEDRSQDLRLLVRKLDRSVHEALRDRSYFEEYSSARSYGQESGSRFSGSISRKRGNDLDRLMECKGD